MYTSVVSPPFQNPVFSPLFHRNVDITWRCMQYTVQVQPMGWSVSERASECALL